MVHIITDTTSGLDPAFGAQHEIPIIPQIIHFGQESFRECEEMDSRMFMERLLQEAALPQTAAPPPEFFHPYLERLCADGEPVLCVHPSSKVSGTVRSAMVAKQSFPDADIRVMDTLTIAGPLGWMVIKAVEWAEQGLSADEIWARLEGMTTRAQLYFTVDTLEFLQRGGRIGGARALLGNLLSIRPILTVKEGQVEPFATERTRRRALGHIMEIILDKAPHDRDPLFSVMHAAAPDVAAEMERQVRSAFPQASVLVQDLVPAIVTHGGPGAIALGFFS